MWAQTKSVNDFLIRKNEVNPSSSLIVKSPEKKILALKRASKIIFYRKIEDEFYIVLPKERLAEENVLIIGNANDNWKQSANLKSTAALPATFAIEFLDLDILKNEALKNGITILSMQDYVFTAQVAVPDSRALDALLHSTNITFIAPSQRPVEESPNSLQDLSVNRINTVHHRNPELNGDGLTVAVKERSIDTTDIDLKNRFVLTNLADPIVSLHANQISTIIAGGGNSQPSAKGIAWKSSVLSSSYDNLFPDDITILKSHNAYLQNHSYGTVIESFYGAEAKAYDQLAIANPYNLNVFSSGNAGMSASADGQYQNISGYANITGNMKMAKNVLVAGGHQSFYELDARNSNGPAYDGRLKPEIVAFGPEGTSDAAAFVSGTGVLLQQFYKSQYGVLPTIDLLKTTLIATADDVASDGIDFKTGYGALNATRALSLLEEERFVQGSVADNAEQLFQITVPANVKRATFCLNWIDPAANANAPVALVNDLDLVITNPASTQFRPWVLSKFPHVDSLAKAPARKADHLNNVEFITIDFPEAGVYSLVVSGYNVTTSTQDFSIAYDFQLINDFTFTYPTGSDPARLDECIVRWQTSFEGSGTLSMSINGSPFTVVTDNATLENMYYAFNPQASGKIILKMEVGASSFFSDEFTIAAQPIVHVGFLCEDEVMISWSKVAEANNYEVYTMGSKYLTHLNTTADTMLIISRDALPSDYVAVEPVIVDKPGYRSASYDVTAQGVGCYYSGIFATEENGNASLTLQLSTRYNVKWVNWYKKVDGSYVKIGTSAPTGGNTAVYFSDQDLIGGVSEYRAGIVLETGEEIETVSVLLYYAADTDYFIFPNPVDRAIEQVKVLTDGNGVSLYFYDTTGALVKAQEIITPLFYFTVDELKAGLYFYRFQRGNKKVASGKILLR